MYFGAIYLAREGCLKVYLSGTEALKLRYRLKKKITICSAIHILEPLTIIFILFVKTTTTVFNLPG